MTAPVRRNVVTLSRHRPERDEARLNAEWDRLLQLAEDAWTWRDPQTVAAVALCLMRLGQRVLEEWKE